MKHEINECKSGLDITIDDMKNKRNELLKAFQECQEGKCSCPTEEYKNLESLEIEETTENITLHLKYKEGTKININEINKCLEHTERKVTNK